MSVTPTSRLGLLSTKNTSPTAVTTGDHAIFNDVPNSCTSSFLVGSDIFLLHCVLFLRQIASYNISELDLIHKNLEAYQS